VEEVQVAAADNIQTKTLPCLLLVMPKKNSDLKVGATVRLKAQSGEIITGQVVHMWEEKSVHDGSGCVWRPGVQRSGEYVGR